MSNSLRNDPAFLEALALHHDDLVRFARSLTRSRDDAQDLVAETILKALESWHTVRDTGAFRVYVFRIAHRLYMRQQLRRRLFHPWPEDYDTTSSDPLPDVMTDATLIREAMQKLPARHRECLIMVDLLGWSLAEVVEVHGGTIGGLKARLFRAREALKNAITGGHDDH
ncbi:MAG: RNA polymerase sigma factor [Candidatus Kapabacteria bacterium]|nr:RNA polymerase sigma factor [Candidatus Kapabacteria bacterium]